MAQIAAFSKSQHKALCSDCGKPASDLIEYVAYQVGDVACTLHRLARANALGRRIVKVTQLRYADSLRLVKV